MASAPEGFYWDWQPTKWLSLELLGEAIRSHATAAGWPIDSAVELGCGSATLLAQLAREGIRCRGFDRDPDALELAREAIGTMNLREAMFPVLEDADVMTIDVSDADRADLAFSIGVIEHGTPDEQLALLRRHVEFTRRWVMIAVPNMESPLFRTFLQSMADDGTLYEDHHLACDVESLAEAVGIEIALSDGCHLFLSRHRDYRFADSELSAFHRRLRGSLMALDQRYSDFPDLDMSGSDISALKAAEKGIGRPYRLRFGFLRWYLLDCARLLAHGQPLR